jgi:hypothetical protein
MATENPRRKPLPRGQRKGWPVLFPGKGDKPTTITLTDDGTKVADKLVAKLEISKSEIVEGLLRYITPGQEAILLELRRKALERGAAKPEAES